MVNLKVLPQVLFLNPILFSSEPQTHFPGQLLFLKLPHPTAYLTLNDHGVISQSSLKSNTSAVLGHSQI